MVNLLSGAGAALILAGLAALIAGLVGTVRAVLRRRAYLARPLPAEGQGIWAGAMTAQEVYVPGTIVRRLAVVAGGLLLAAAAAPLLWAGWALREFTTVGEQPVLLAGVERLADGTVRVDVAGGGRSEGRLPEGILVAHAEYISFRGGWARGGLATHVRLVSLSSYADPRQVLMRRAGGELRIAAPSLLFRAASRLQRRFPDSIEAVRRFSGPRREATAAELWADPTGLRWR